MLKSLLKIVSKLLRSGDVSDASDGEPNKILRWAGTRKTWIFKCGIDVVASP